MEWIEVGEKQKVKGITDSDNQTSKILWRKLLRCD